MTHDSSAFCYNGSMFDFNHITNAQALYDAETDYGHIQVADTLYEDEPVCFLFVNGLMESAMYLDEEKKYDLLFPYLQRLSYAFAVNPDIQDTLMVGGGGFSYPKYYLHNYPDARIKVCEISRDIIDIARKYFGVSDLDESMKERLSVYCGDGFSLMEEHPHSYDLIINDAFIGREEIGRSEKDIMAAHKNLKDTGIYMTNLIASPTGKYKHIWKHYQTLLKRYFKYTALILTEEDFPDNLPQNLLLAASDTELL